MRNLPWEIAEELATRRLNFRNYFRYGDVWVPKDIAQGDIVRCDLPTDYMQTGKPEIRPRNCLVLGVEVNRETFELEALRLVRLSYNVLDVSEETELCINPKEKGFRLQAGGLERPFVVRTGKVETVPIDSEYFGFYMDRTTRFNRSLFPLVKKYLGLAEAKGTHNNLRNSYPETDAAGSFFLPGISVASCEKAPFNFGRDRTASNITNYFDLGDEERDEFRDRLGSAAIAKIIERPSRLRDDRSIMNAQRLRETETRIIIDQFIRQMRREHSSETVSRVLESVATHLDSLEQCEARSPGVMTMPAIRQIMAEQLNEVVSKSKMQNAGLQKILEQKIDDDSLKHLVDFGIGGLLREPAIQLPEQLWRGRFVMMRIPSLLNADQTSEDVYRPCALWKAYAKINEQGEPELAGLELHPSTRSSADAFKFKMKVRPIDTVVKIPSYLIADMVIRAPINSQYFQPHQQSGLFYDLLPHQVAEMGVKRDMAQKELGHHRVYGVQQVPEDWIEIQIPSPPDERLRQRLVRGGVKFTPSGGGAHTSTRGLVRVGKHNKFG